MKKYWSRSQGYNQSSKNIFRSDRRISRIHNKFMGLFLLFLYQLCQFGLKSRKWLPYMKVIVYVGTHANRELLYIMSWQGRKLKNKMNCALKARLKIEVKMKIC